MLNFLIHFYQLAEIYAVILSWITIPLGYYACYLFLRNHYGMFIPTVEAVRKEEKTGNAAN